MVAVEILKQSFRMAEYISIRKVQFQFPQQSKTTRFCSQRLYSNKDLILNPFPAAGTPCFAVLIGQKYIIWGHLHFAVDGCDDSLLGCLRLVGHLQETYTQLCDWPSQNSAVYLRKRWNRFYGAVISSITPNLRHKSVSFSFTSQF